ncbi:hypothetical protein IW148_005034 [Coemansia sp. RSA 1199]|nr:hypothetical protein IW148_005034 [Coemansia sp. RSA 1199]
MHLTANQVLARIKQSGTFDTMRTEMLAEFVASPQGQAFDKTVRALMQRMSDDSDMSRASDKHAYLERRLIEQLKHNGRMERMERDARNHWLSVPCYHKVGEAIERAVSQSRDSTEHKVRALHVDPPRMQSRGSRSHNYYRRGDVVAAFVPLDDSLCHAGGYICLQLEIDACDAVRNMYTVRDVDCARNRQTKWAVYWDQILAIKRPYEQVYRRGDQVYAVYRDDYGDSKVSSEYFPARIDAVGRDSLAVRYDAGGMAHVHYDEVFAAGRVGFMRQMSETRKRSGSEDAVVEVGGRFVPSFTGFWPETARPEVEKYGRVSRTRAKPEILVEHGREVREMRHVERQPVITYAQEESSGQHSSDMEIDSSATSPSPPRVEPIEKVIVQPTPVGKVQVQPKLVEQVEAPLRPTVQTHALPQPMVQTNAPPRPLVQTRPIAQIEALAKPTAKPPSPEEDGEIDMGGNEDGELNERTPEIRDTRVIRRSPSRSSSRWQRSPRYERPPSRSRSRSRWSSRSRDRSRSTRFDRSRDYSRRRYSERYNDEYRPQYRPRSRSRSVSRGRVRHAMSPPYHPVPYGLPPPPPPLDQTSRPYPPPDHYAPPGNQHRGDYH